MTKYQYHPDYQEVYEYHGNTMIECIRKNAGEIFSREWLVFDTVEEAIDYFNSSC